jgi:hypothetical protein
MPGYYWLVVQATNGVFISYTNTAGESNYGANPSEFFPDPFGVVTPQNRIYCIYADFCASIGYLVTATVTPTFTVTGTITPTYTITPTSTATGTATLTCTATFASSSTFTPTITYTPTPSLDEPGSKDSYVYPMPASDSLTLVYSLDEPAAVAINIFDFAGNRVKEISTNAVNSKTNKETIDVKSLKAGIYYYIIKANTSSGNTVKYKVNKFIIKK